MGTITIHTVFTPNGLCGVCDLLPNWIVTCTGDLDAFKKEIIDSIDFYIEAAREDKEDYPHIFDDKYEIIYQFDVKSLLNHYQGIFSFSALQTITGINQKQLAHYAAGRSIPRPQQAEKIVNGLHKLAKELLTITI